MLSTGISVMPSLKQVRPGCTFLISACFFSTNFFKISLEKKQTNKICVLWKDNEFRAYFAKTPKTEPKANDVPNIFCSTSPKKFKGLQKYLFKIDRDILKIGKRDCYSFLVAFIKMIYLYNKDSCHLFLKVYLLPTNNCGKLDVDNLWVELTAHQSCSLVVLKGRGKLGSFENILILLS